MVDRLETLRYGHDGDPDADNFEEYFTFTRMVTASRIEDRPFRTRASFWRLGELAVTEQVMGPVEARRHAAELYANPADHLTAVVLFDGCFDYLDGTASRCRPGDVLILDYARSFAYRTPGHHGATVSLPRSFVEDRLGRVAVHGLLARSAEARLFERFVRALVGELPDLHPASVPSVSMVARHLLTAALSQQARSQQALHDAAPVPDRRYADARAYVDAQPPGSLDIAVMSRALGISRSRLYRMFAQDGGIRAYDRRRRLRLLHVALVEQPRAITLGDIAARYGFFDLSSLGRQFRAEFGYSMSEVRDHLPPPARPDAGVPVGPLVRFRERIEALSCPPEPAAG